MSNKKIKKIIPWKKATRVYTHRKENNEKIFASIII